MKACIARQPIYANDKSIYGYELLYRNEAGQTKASFTDGNKATRAVVSDAIMAFGLESLTNKKPAFVNFGRELIMSRLLDSIDKNNFIIEILEDTVVDDAFVQCVKLKAEQGYTFALDDYIGDELFDAVLPYVKIIKVDFLLVSGRALRKLTQKIADHTHILLAEKIETQEDYETAKGLGYTLFQGYYFDKPMVISTNISDIKASTCARVFNEISSNAFSFVKLADIIKTDVNLTYMLMRRTNSLQYYRGTEINSVRLALVGMGVEEVKKWTTLVFLRELSGNNNDENTKDALVRALLAEWVAAQSKLDKETAFLAGMFSMIDVIANDNLDIILSQLAVAAEIKDALFGRKSAYTDILTFVCAYECGEWDIAMQYATLFKLHIDEISRVYLDAVKYADKLFA